MSVSPLDTTGTTFHFLTHAVKRKWDTSFESECPIFTNQYDHYRPPRCHFGALALFGCNSCHVVALIQQDITVYDKEKDIISVVSVLRFIPTLLAVVSSYTLLRILWDVIDSTWRFASPLQCRQLVAVCDEILSSSSESLLTHTAQLESVDLVPVAPGDQLVKPNFETWVLFFVWGKMLPLHSIYSKFAEYTKFAWKMYS